MARNAEGECTCAGREFMDLGVLDSGQQVAWYRCPECGVWAWKPLVFVLDQPEPIRGMVDAVFDAAERGDIAPLTFDGGE